MQAESLNKQFALDNHLQFVAGKGGLTEALIRNPLCSARVSLYAGQVLAWQPQGQSQDVLFLSEQAYYQDGKAIKGGVPVCWPWFGPDPQGKGRPAHGVARTSTWNVVETSIQPDGATRLLLELPLDSAAQTVCGGDLRAQLEIVAGSRLRLTLTTTNHSTSRMAITQALHTYFAVGDISQVTVTGLEGTRYIDKVAGGEHDQHGALDIHSEVDRIYTGVHSDVQIRDAALQRVIRVHATGSASAVVWNPWQAIAASMADLGDEDYRRMLCVETANAGPDVIDLEPGGQHAMLAEYSVTGL